MPLIIIILLTALVIWYIYIQKPEESLPMVDINEPLPAATSPSNSEKVIYVDVRTPEEFMEGSVDGSVNMPLDQVEYRINEFKDKDRIVVFCRSGNRAGQAKRILENHGITNVINGGSWQEVQQSLK